MTTSPRKSIVHAELNVQEQTKSRQRSPCQHSYDYNPLNSTEYVMHTTREQQKGQLDTVRAQVEELQNLIVASSEETVSLRKEVGIKEARIMLLEGQLARSQCRQSELNDDTDDHRFEMNQLRETIGTYEQELEILRSEGCTRAAAHAKLEFEASELERVNADLLSQNRSLQSQIQVKDKILQDREIELSRLQSVVDGSGVGPDGQESCLSILRDRNARLQKELLASVQQVRQYREKSLETVKKLQELDFEKAAEQRRCHAKEVECEELKSRLESMSAEIAKYDEELRRRMVDVRTFKERYETLRSSFDTLQIQAKYKEDLLGKLSGELKDYSGVAVSSHEETARLRIELRKYIDECTALNEKLNTFRSMHEHDISERRSTIESLQMRLHESVETVAVTDLDVMSKAYDIRLRAMQDKIHHLREELVATQAKNVELRSGNLQNEQYHEDLASREHYINEQENTVEILQGQVHDLSQEIRSRIDVEHRLSSQIDALEVENTKLKIIASHAEARIQSLEQRVHIHEKEVTTQRENIEWTAGREVRYIRQVEDLREKLKYKQDECEVLRAQCARWGMYEPEELALLPDYQARLQSYAAEVETLHELLHQKMKELEDYQELDSWANRARDKIDRLQESSLIHEEMAQLQEARDTIHALERRVEVLTEAAALVHQQAIVLEKENERLHEEVIRLQGSSTNHQNQRGVQERDSIAVVAETHPRGSQPMGINATARSVHERYLRPTPSKASQNAKDVPDSSVISQYKFRNSAVFREHPHPGLDGPSYSSSFLANVSPIPKAPYSARTTGSRTAFATTHGYDTVDSRAMHWDDSRTENIPPLKTMPIYAPFHGLDLPKSPPRLNSARPNRQHHVF